MTDRLLHYVFMFVDVVRYSALGHRKQLEVGTKLSEVVADTPLGNSLKTPENGVFLSTGDGFALAFLNDIVQTRPQHVLQLAREIQKEMAPYRLRIGLHQGTAQPYADFNARFYSNDRVRNNIAGTGINVAQRVMNLGDAGHIMCSSQFVSLFHDAEPKEADATFSYLGRIRVKHGLELDIHKVGDDVLPTRIRNYKHAQDSVKSHLRHICDVVSKVAHGSVRKDLRPRASILAYDPAADGLYVTTLRVGPGFGDSPPISRLTFSLTEGPGRAFAQARDGRAIVTYVELPDVTTVGLGEYGKSLQRQSGIASKVVSQFSRKARLYVYFPILQGTDRHNPLGVLSLDMEAPLFDHDELRDRLKRRGTPVDRIEEQFEKSARKYRDALSREMQPWLRQLSEAWSMLIHY